jgi:hypothetical protein
MSNGSVAPFAATSAISASTTSATATLAGIGESLLITNNSASIAFLTFGPVASPSGAPVLPGSHRVLQAGPYATQVSAVLLSGSGTIYCTPGVGGV